MSITRQLSRYAGNNIYNITDAKVLTYCKIYERMFFAQGVFYIALPAMLTFYASRTGTRSIVQMDVGFFNDLYFINVSYSPMRELCYFIQTAGVFAAIFLAYTIDLLFVGLCLYIAAMYKELQEMLESIDRNSNVLLTQNKKVRDNQRSLRNYCENHLAVISFTETINDVYSNIIFIQFSLSLLGMCSNIFELLLTSRSHMPKVVGSIILFSVGLLMYCWFGQLVHNEATRLESTIYGVQWYEYSITDQKMIKLMLLRSQISCGFAAYNYFECDLPTFFNIMTNVYSLVSFLQGMI